MEKYWANSLWIYQPESVLTGRHGAIYIIFLLKLRGIIEIRRFVSDVFVESIDTVAP